MPLTIEGNTRSRPRRRQRPRDDGARNHAEDLAAARLIRARASLYAPEVQRWAAGVLKGGSSRAE